jgi:Tfp pilus assembly protein PilF
MKSFRLLGLLALAGCWPNPDPAPEETALERYEVAEKHFAEGNYADAGIEYEYAIQHRWRWKAAYVRLASCHEKLGNEDGAVSVYQRLLKVDDTDEDALRALGRIHAKRSDAARALPYYRKLQALHPADPALAAEVARLEALRKP